MAETFKALLVKEESGKFFREITERKFSDLPDGEILMEVRYSSLNYKDALSAIGNKGVTKVYPHVPGIDAAGIVAESYSEKFKSGEEVLITGYDLGMNTPGGFAGFISVPADWVIKLPQNLSLKESMILGTAGFTAALSLYKLELNGLKQDSGEVLITGGTGGVGSMAAAILSKAGYDVTVSTGKPEEENYLKSLGVKNILHRSDVQDKSGKPMLKGRYAAVIDTVGGTTLETAIASVKMFGSVALCGLVESPKFSTTVYPFILRGINLLGINSAETKMDLRLKLWEKLSGEWKPDKLNEMYVEHSLEELNNDIDLILQGKLKRKVLVNLNKN